VISRKKLVRVIFGAKQPELRALPTQV